MRRCVYWMLRVSALVALLCGPAWAFADEEGPAAATSSGDETAHAAAESAPHGDAQGASHEGNVNPLEVNPDLAIFTLIIFVVLLIVLTKFAWRPIAEALDQREKSMAEELEAARRNHEESQQLLKEHEKKLAHTAEEVRGMLEGARREAELQKQSILDEAQRAAQAEKHRAVREIDAAKNNALEALARTSVDQAVGLAGALLGNS